MSLELLICIFAILVVALICAIFKYFEEKKKEQQATHHIEQEPRQKQDTREENVRKDYAHTCTKCGNKMEIELIAEKNGGGCLLLLLAVVCFFGGSVSIIYTIASIVLLIVACTKFGKTTTKTYAVCKRCGQKIEIKD